MKRVILYVEGGGNPDADTALREAFRKFLGEIDDLGQANGYAPLNVKLCGPRRTAYRIFCDAVGRDSAGENFHLLLVDSETPVAEHGACWKHLKNNPEDTWERPAGVDDTQCHLMAQAMEAWFFADPDALADFYKDNFNKSALPTTRDVEQIAKTRHKSALEAATKNTTKGRYHKTRHAPRILEALDPNKVRARAPHCDRLFETLRAKITTAS